MSALWRPWWTSPRAPLLPTMTQSAPPSLRPRPRFEGAYVGVLVAFEGTCVGGKLSPPPCHCHLHHRRTLLPLPPPPPCCRRHTATAAAKLPHSSCRRHHCPHHRVAAVAPPLSPPLSPCRCSQAVAAPATTAPSWHRSASAAAAAAKLPSVPPRCHLAAKQLLPPAPSCRHCQCGIRHCHKLPPPAPAASAAGLPPPYCRCCRAADAAKLLPPRVLCVRGCFFAKSKRRPPNTPPCRNLFIFYLLARPYA
jgi:hypothetical protein